ncbi:LOW QUALITY PROTEIN: hypothetical protein Cgig2_012260 [Carnegiea gigantea]|uniref:Uncharacterized protein n=1 Tax=Carnegiea gigantea TaxID=171969 RepID=A0A9Q1K565_9CARY|nr:LOW QUALITY PROTEIN: hypothetical protein Cgig2_012260 [Carnegiea gigantea]
MAFPRSLDTTAMYEYVTRHFSWNQYGVAFPVTTPKRLLGPIFELAVAEEAAEYYELPELPQVIFYAILLNKAERLGVLQGRWVWLYGGQIFEARFCPKVGSGESSIASRQEEGSDVEPEDEDRPLRGWPPLGIVTSRGEVVKPMNKRPAPTSSCSFIRCLGIHLPRESGIKHRKRSVYSFSPVTMAFPHLYNTREMPERRRASRPPRTLPENFHALCPCFSWFEAKGTATDFELPEMLQATCYAMLLNEAVKLGVTSSFMVKGLKSAPVGLRWSSFKVWMNYVDHKLREAQLQQ